MNDDVNWNLLAKHLFGECSEEEAARLQAWIEGDPARRALLEELRQVRGLTGSASPEDETWDTDRLWERVREETTPERASADGRAAPDGRAAVRLPDAAGSEDRPTEDRPAPVPEPAARQEHAPRARRPSRGIRSSRRARPVLRRAAVGAVLLVAATLALLWTRGLLEEGKGASAPEAKTFATQEGQRAVIRLTDGTRVHLNVDSRLVRPASFGEERRVVRLEGEAFFEVARDTARPFIVHAGGATTQVLGTAFDVSAYPDAEGTQVVVKEGRVAARSVGPGPPAAGQEPAAGPEEDVVLTGGQMGQFLRSGEQVVRKGIDARRHVAWMEGELLFEDAPFERVVRKLERWYDLEVTLSDTSGGPPRGHLNARFAEGEPLEEVLGVVATAFGLEHEHRRGGVTFARKAPRSP